MAYRWDVRQAGIPFRRRLGVRSDLPNAPQTALYKACGGRSCNISTLHLTMGLSVGWADIYYASVPYRWIDITRLANGKYILTLTADPDHYFGETDNANNWA